MTNRSSQSDEQMCSIAKDGRKRFVTSFLVSFVVLAGGFALAQYTSTKLKQLNEKREHDLKLVCMRVLMWLNVDGKLRGLNVLAFDELLPLAQKSTTRNGNTRYEWKIRPENNEGLSFGWIEVGNAGVVVDGGTLSAEF